MGFISEFLGERMPQSIESARYAAMLAYYKTQLILLQMTSVCSKVQDTNNHLRGLWCQYMLQGPRLPPRNSRIARISCDSTICHPAGRTSCEIQETIFFPIWLEVQIEHYATSCIWLMFSQFFSYIYASGINVKTICHVDVMSSWTAPEVVNWNWNGMPTKYRITVT